MDGGVRISLKKEKEKEEKVRSGFTRNTFQK
jgi:hypothetical protein